jgi:beta-phosphoglucomutase
MPAIKAVIFDMDGVLIDAKEWHYEAMNRALAEHGYTITREEHLAEFDGLPTTKKLELLTAKKGLPRDLHPVIGQRKQCLTLALIESECRPRLPTVRALSRLKQDGYVVGVASNSVRQTVTQMMQLSQLDRYLDFMLSNEDVRRPKPDPEIYLAAAKQAGATPQDCVVVEDNHHGIEAATRAGANVLAVEGVDDVTYERIQQFLASLHSGQTANSAAKRRTA